jgi:hypothetical protein
MSTAQTDQYGDRRWYNSEGELHREDGPAIEYIDGSREWWVNGELHRTDGPAREWASGSRAWYLHGQLHRTDGPAREWADGFCVWYLHGEHLNFAEWLDKTTTSPHHQTLLRLRWSS